MSYFFTNNFRRALFDNPNLMTGASFRIRLFRSAPSLSSPAASSWLDASTVAELTSFIGWEEVAGIAGYPSEMHTQSALTVRREGLNNYVLLDQYTFDNLGSEIRIEGLGIEYASGPLNGIANPLIFVTNTPVGTFMNLDPGDILTSNQDLKLGLAANRWLLAWADTPVVPVGEPQPDWTSLRVIEGPLAFLFAPPLFESSNTLHVWLYPQRANMISNPSFEYDNSQWAPVPTRVREAAFAPVLKGTVSDANALLALAPEVGDFYAVASDPIAQDYPIWEYKGPDPNDDLTKWTNHGVQTGKGWAGKFTAVGTAPMAVESNVWETRLGYDDEETWTLQLLAKGTGKLKLALVSWDIDYRTTGVDWGTETWDLVPGAWVHCTCVRYGPQAHTAMMRIEVVSGGDTQEVILDRVLAERGALKEYPYFDGDEHFGAADDFSWYGGAGRRGVSYSMWYGGRRAVIGRMFATPAVHEGELLTDVDVMAAGMVYDWVPAGVTVIPHLDVFYPTDLHGPLPPRRPTTLPPLGPDDPLGVDDPWTQDDLPTGLWLGSTIELGAAGVSGAMTAGGAANVAATAHTIWPPFTPPPITFEYADATAHDVAVPAGVNTAILECWGAGPGAAAPLTLNGNGAYIKGTVTDLTPSEILRLTPGGIGAYAGAGGFNGGGACTGLGGSDGNGGNGASDIRRGGTALANRILVGGAGGGGINASGGGRGGHAGHPNGDIGTAFSGNGGGGTQTAGGASVAGPPNGTLGVGATSPSGPGGGRGGGGGGGGYYGGGAGASGFGTSCSGGGGSSYYHTSLSNVTAETVGTWTGAGKVKVTFILPPSEGAWGATAVGVPTTPAPLVGSTAYSAGSGASPASTLTWPRTPVAGEIAVLYMTRSNGASFPTLPDFGAPVHSGDRGAVYTRLCTGAEAVSYSVVIGGSAQHVSVIVLLPNLSSLAEVGWATVAAASTPTNVVYPTITPSAQPSKIIYSIHDSVRDGASVPFTNPGGTNPTPVLLMDSDTGRPAVTNSTRMALFIGSCTSVAALGSRSVSNVGCGSNFYHAMTLGIRNT